MSEIKTDNDNLVSAETIQKLLRVLEDARFTILVAVGMLSKMANDIPKAVKDLGIKVIEDESLESLGIKVAKS